jgi:tetratricopeptide (TPR) repeat protein/tRNA A-37 threonylcarbamoyl transferase component Bud32
MSELRCVSDPDLRAYVLGKLPERISRSVADHLECCSECATRAQGLDGAADPLVDCLRHALKPTATLGVTSGDGSAATAAGGAVLPATRLGAYCVLGEVGRGGMAVVYKARQDNPERIVALKVLLTGSHSGSERRARFRSEADTIARLRHAHIVQVFEAGEQDGLPFLALEFCEGGSLAQRLGGVPQAPEAAAALVVHLAEALEHAHQAGIIHRDLKPVNILLTADGQPKVSDFGLARTEGPSLTATGAVLGTPSYMAPEQASASRTVGPAADIYALGAILYELLTGRPPFQGATALETLEQVRGQEPVPPRRLQPKVPRDLETVCLKCLEKEPAKRYATAGALADDLKRFGEGRPVRARPVGALGRSWRWARRNPLWASTLAGVATLLLAVAVGMSWMTWQLNAALEASESARLRAESAEIATGQALSVSEGERQKAAAAEADTKAFNDFLANHVLAASRPEGLQDGIGVNVTMAEALDKADAQLDRVFAGRPRAEAAARHSIGVTWRDLGRDADAIRHLRRAVDLRVEFFGPDVHETLDAMNSLAMAYLSAGQFDRGLTLLEDVVTRREQTLGPEHANTLLAISRLGGGYSVAGHPERGVPLLEQALDKQTRTLGSDHAETLTTLATLAAALRLAGHADRAVPLFEQVLAKYKKDLGPAHPLTLQAMNSLARAHQDLGRTDLALPLAEEALARGKEKFGPDHPDTLILMSNLADSYQTAGQVDRAIKLYEPALVKCKEKLGPDHRYTLTVMDNLGTAYQDAGQLDRALPLFQEALARCKDRFGADHPDTLLTLNNLAGLYWAMKKFDKAISLFEEALPRCEKSQGAGHFATIRVAFNLAANQTEAGHNDKALALCDEWLPRTRALPPGHPVRTFGQNTAITVYTRAGRRDKVEPLLREQADVVKQQSGADSPAYAVALAVVGVNLVAQNKHADAEPFLRSSLAIRMQKTPDDWTTFNSRSMLGAALIGQRKYAEAEPLLVEGYEGMKQRGAKIPPQGKIRLTEALERLVQLYSAWDKPEQAATWRRELEAQRK